MQSVPWGISSAYIKCIIKGTTKREEINARQREQKSESHNSVYIKSEKEYDDNHIFSISLVSFRTLLVARKH